MVASGAGGRRSASLRSTKAIASATLRRRSIRVCLDAAAAAGIRFPGEKEPAREGPVLKFANSPYVATYALGATSIMLTDVVPMALKPSS